MISPEFLSAAREGEDHEASLVVGPAGRGGALTGVLVLATAGLSAKRAEEAKKETSKSPTAGQLPIAQVVLFSSGVGYFQREGTAEGSAST